MPSKSFFYAIAINNYANGISELKSPRSDAEKLANFLHTEKKYTANIIDPGHSDLDGIRDFIRNISNDTDCNDRVILYFACHGETTENNEIINGYIVPSNGRPMDPASWLSMKEVLDLIDPIECRHMLLIMDCCFAGSIRWVSGSRELGFWPQKIYKEHFERFTQFDARQVLVSCAFDQKAQDEEKRGGDTTSNSPFLNYLIKGLEGSADLTNDGIITATELYIYLRDNVEKKKYVDGSSFFQTPLLFPLKKHDKGEYVFFRVDPDTLTLEDAPNNNPYNKELVAYEADNYRDFFGRDKVIEALAQNLKEKRILFISGVSGSGKSSLLKAGLLPQVADLLNNEEIGPANGHKKNFLSHEAFIIRPTEDITHCSNNLNKLNPETPSTLIIDQFEEIATSFKNDDAQLGALTALIGDWIRSYDKRYLVLSMRSDYEYAIKDTLQQANVPEINELLSNWQYHIEHIPWFSREELRQIIVEPFFQIAYLYKEPQLIDRIIDEVLQSPGMLPSLSVTLSLLYETVRERDKEGTSNERRRLICTSDYELVGGVFGSLFHKTEKTVASLISKDSKRILTYVLMRLVTADRDARRKAYLADFDYNYSPAKLEIKSILKLLRDSQLVIPGKDIRGDYYELVHESLIARSIFKKFLDEYSASEFRLIDQFGTAAKDYNETGVLWDDHPELDKLEQKRLKGFLNTKEEDFLQKSIEARDKVKWKKRRNKWIFIGGGVLIMLILSGLWWVLNQNRKSAKKNQALNLAKDASKYAPSESIRMLEAAYLIDPLGSDYERAIQEIYEKSTQQLTFSSHSNYFESEIKDFRTIGDKGDRFLIWNSKDSCFLQDTSENFFVRIGFCSLENVIISEGKEFFAVTDDIDSNIILHNSKGKIIRNFNEGGSSVKGKFSSDGNNFIVSYYSIDSTNTFINKVLAFDLKNGSTISTLLQHPIEIYDSYNIIVDYVPALQRFIIGYDHPDPNYEYAEFGISEIKWININGSVNDEIKGQITSFDGRSGYHTVRSKSGIEILNFLSGAKKNIPFPPQYSTFEQYEIIYQSTNGKWLAAWGSTGLILWKANSTTPVGIFHINANCRKEVLFSEDNEQGLVVGKDSLYVINLNKLKLIGHKLLSQDNSCPDAQIRRSGDFFIIPAGHQDVLFDLASQVQMPFDKNFLKCQFTGNGKDTICALAKDKHSIHYFPRKSFGYDARFINGSGKAKHFEYFNGKLLFIDNFFLDSMQLALNIDKNDTYKFDITSQFISKWESRLEPKIIMEPRKIIINTAAFSKTIDINFDFPDILSTSFYLSTNYMKLIVVINHVNDDKKEFYIVDMKKNVASHVDDLHAIYEVLFKEKGMIVLDDQRRIRIFDYTGKILSERSLATGEIVMRDIQSGENDKQDVFLLCYRENILFIESMATGRKETVKLENDINEVSYIDEGSFLVKLKGSSWESSKYIIINSLGQRKASFEESNDINYIYFDTSFQRTYYILNDKLHIHYSMKEIDAHLKTKEIALMPPHLRKKYKVK